MKLITMRQTMTDEEKASVVASMRAILEAIPSEYHALLHTHIETLSVRYYDSGIRAGQARILDQLKHMIADNEEEE